MLHSTRDSRTMRKSAAMSRAAAHVALASDRHRLRHTRSCSLYEELSELAGGGTRCDGLFPYLTHSAHLSGVGRRRRIRPGARDRRRGKRRRSAPFHRPCLFTARRWAEARSAVGASSHNENLESRRRRQTARTPIAPGRRHCGSGPRLHAPRACAPCATASAFAFVRPESGPQ